MRTEASAEANEALEDYSDAMIARNYAAALAAQERFTGAQAILGRERIGIDDRDTIRLATLQVLVPVRNAQMADPEMTSVLALFRRAANVIARLEDAIVFRGLAPNRTVTGGFAPPAGVIGLPGDLADHRRAKGGGALVAHLPSRVVSSVPKTPRATRSRDRKRGLRRHWPS